MGGIARQVSTVDSEELCVSAGAGGLATGLRVSKVTQMKIVDPTPAECFG